MSKTRKLHYSYTIQNCPNHPLPVCEDNSNEFTVDENNPAQAKRNAHISAYVASTGLSSIEENEDNNNNNSPNYYGTAYDDSSRLNAFYPNDLNRFEFGNPFERGHIMKSGDDEQVVEEDEYDKPRWNGNKVRG